MQDGNLRRFRGLSVPFALFALDHEGASLEELILEEQTFKFMQEQEEADEMRDSALRDLEQSIAGMDLVELKQAVTVLESGEGEIRQGVTPAEHLQALY